MDKIKTRCDICKKHVREVGKLFKVNYLYLCKNCRRKYKYTPIRRRKIRK